MKHKHIVLHLMALALILTSVSCSAPTPAATPTLAPTAIPKPVLTNTPVATAAPEVKLGNEKRLEDQGFSFRPLPNYQLDTSLGVQMLAPKADPDTGPAFMLAGGEAVEGTTAESLIASLKSAEIEVSGPKAIIVNGIAGLSSEIKRPAGDLAGRVIAVMVKTDQQFIMFGLAPKVQWDQETRRQFDAVLGSVKFIEIKVQAAATPVPIATPVETAKATPTQTAKATPTVAANVTPQDFLWRTGGASGFDEDVFVTMGGMDASPNDLIYVADGMRGVWVLDPLGNVQARIDNDAMSQAADVQWGPDGNIYVAAWNSHSVFVFSPDGKLVRHFGEAGNGNGQFGQFSPTDLAVGPDGRVYVYDENKDSTDKNVYRIQIFDAQGKWIKSFPVKDEWAAPDGMEFGPDDTLYTVSFIDSAITKYNAEGKLLGTVHSNSLDQYNGAQDLDIDAYGNFYIAMWDIGVLKVDPQGKVIARRGTSAGEIEEQSWPEGAAYRPSGVAALQDGSVVTFSDSSGYYAYVTGFNFSGGSIAIPSNGRQWAISATASSEYSSSSWSASQAAGAPNVSACGDSGKAWASEGTNTVEWIELLYEWAEVPVQVNIYQTFNPGQIVKVELLDVEGAYHEIYNSKPTASGQCPATLEINVQNAKYLAAAVRITVDQSSIKNWTEIDAVEFVSLGSR